MEPINNTPESVKTLTPIKTLFSDSYKVIKGVFVPFLLFNILMIAISAVAFLMMLFGFILLGVGAGLSGLFENNLLTLGVGTVASFLLIFIILYVISSIAQIGQVFILYEANPKVNIFSIIKRSARFIVPLIVLGIISTFLVGGGIFLFVIPGIIFSILFSLSYFVLLTEKTTPLGSLRRSFFIVKSNFVPFFLRILALYGALLLAMIVFSIVLAILESILDESTIIVVHIFNLLFQLAVGWFVVSYMVTLFKDLQRVSPSGESSLKKITIFAILGWLVGIALGYLAFNGIMRLIELNKSNNYEENLTPNEREELDRILEEIDSDFNIDDIDQYLDEGTESSEIETSTPPAQTI